VSLQLEMQLQSLDSGELQNLMQPTLIKGLCSGRSWSGFVHIDEVEGGVSRAGLPIDLRCRNRTTTVLYCTSTDKTNRASDRLHVPSPIEEGLEWPQRTIGIFPMLMLALSLSS
jgi:hypothetical protein